jgi:Domain of unknown function (DUF4411)
VKQPERFDRYCIDTSSFINLHLWRPARQHPEPWRHLGTLVEQDRLIAPRAVLEELAARDDALVKWARRHKELFKRPTRDLVSRVQEILRRFPDLVDPNATGRSADPFVVALAVEESSNTLVEKVTVVTEEKYAPGRPRIPHVCQAYDIKYLTLHQMFVFEGWQL